MLGWTDRRSTGEVGKLTREDPVSKRSTGEFCKSEGSRMRKEHPGTRTYKEDIEGNLHLNVIILTARLLKWPVTTLGE